MLYCKSPIFQGVEALSCVGDRSFENHLHSGYVIWLNSEGGERFAVDGSSEVLQQGCVSIIEPGVIHSNFPVNAQKRHLRSLYVEESFFVELAHKLQCSASDCYLLGGTFKDQIIWKEFIRLHEMILSGCGAMPVETELIEVFSSLLRKRSNLKVLDPTMRCDVRLQRVKEYLHDNIASSIQLDDLAAVAGCSSWHLIRLFRENMQMTPHAYLVQMRLEYARQLISKGVALADSAFSSGFSDQSHLTRKFSIRYGVTPRTYQKQIIAHF